MLFPPADPDLPTGSSTQEIYDYEYWSLEAGRGVRLYARLMIVSLVPAAFTQDPIALGVFLYVALAAATMRVLLFVCRRGLRKAVARARAESRRRVLQ